MNMLSISIGNDLVKRSSSLLFLVGLAVAAISVLTTARAASDLSGQYRMEGRGFGRDDDPYVGTYTLQNTGSAYDVSCFHSSTRHTYVGRGLVNG